MNLNYEILNLLNKKYGESFYLLDSKRFTNNYLELENAFKKINPSTVIAYSYKTNYIPRLCGIVDNLGGYAEVVSEMEYEIAKKLGVDGSRVIYNGPYKAPHIIKEILLNNGIVNIDSVEELKIIEQVAMENPDFLLKVGIRCNFKINDEGISRFGIDIESKDFQEAVSRLSKHANTRRFGVHMHFSSRTVKAWKAKISGMRKVLDQLDQLPIFIDLGGGLFGKMDDALKEQFGYEIPDYQEYAELLATSFQGYGKDTVQPNLIIEPGTALVADAMKYVTKVVSIKEIDTEWIATTSGSKFNIHPHSQNINSPIHIYEKNELHAPEYNGLSFVGYTCVEGDYLYKGYNGTLSLGDFVVFDNVGSYSIVFKPPFIMPNVPVIEIKDNQVIEIKKKENFNDIFKTYIFEFDER